MKKHFFGTDGIRANAEHDFFSHDTLFKIGTASATHFLKQEKETTVIIGKDTRNSSDFIESSIAASISASGVNVILAGFIPTPVVSMLVRELKADYGIVISASHNPYYDNGIKFFNLKGEKLSNEEEIEIETLILNPPLKKNKKFGTIRYYNEMKNIYIDKIIKKFKDKDFSKLNIAADCANGAAEFTAPEIFSKLGLNAAVLNNSSDGFNINKNCGALFPQNISTFVKKSSLDAGVLFDGDADRLIMLDENGSVVDGDILIAISAVYLKNRGWLENNTVVTTVMSNLGFEKYLESHLIKLVRANVGDKNVFYKMCETGAMLGGENSGHIIFKNINPTGDGLVSALMVLSIMAETGEKLSELANKIELFPQISSKIKISSKPDIKTLSETTSILAEIEKDSSLRAVVRYSGTENVLRIMVEGKQKEKAEVFANRLKIAAEKEINS